MKTKTIHKPLLSGGLFDKPFMDSRATTQTVSTKEWVLGHLIGPLGLIFVVNTIAALVEKFFTQQTGAMYGVDNIAMIMKMGGVYEVVMTVAKILAMGTGLLNGWLIQHTQCRQGRMRDFPVPREDAGRELLVLFLLPADLLSYGRFQLFLSVSGHDLFSDVPQSQGEGVYSVYPENVLDTDLRHYYRYAAEHGGASHVAGEGYHRLPEADADSVGHCHSAAAAGILLYP